MFFSLCLKNGLCTEELKASSLTSKVMSRNAHFKVFCVNERKQQQRFCVERGD